MVTMTDISALSQLQDQLTKLFDLPVLRVTAEALVPRLATALRLGQQLTEYCRQTCAAVRDLPSLSLESAQPQNVALASVLVTVAGYRLMVERHAKDAPAPSSSSTGAAGGRSGRPGSVAPLSPSPGVMSVTMASAIAVARATLSSVEKVYSILSPHCATILPPSTRPPPSQVEEFRSSVMSFWKRVTKHESRLACDPHVASRGSNSDGDGRKIGSQCHLLQRAEAINPPVSDIICAVGNSGNLLKRKPEELGGEPEEDGRETAVHIHKKKHLSTSASP